MAGRERSFFSPSLSSVSAESSKMFSTSTAMCDVIADALVVKKARLAGARGVAALQTFCWILYYVGYIIGLPISGNIWSKFHRRFSSSSSYFAEEEAGEGKWTPMTTSFVFSSPFSSTAMCSSPSSSFSCVVQLPPDIGDAYDFYDFWLTDRRDGGLVIGANLQSYNYEVGAATSIIGLLAYGKFFTGTPFRKIFFWAPLAMGILGIMDVAQYKQWNVPIGFPDLAFYFFNCSLSSAVSKLTSMPLLVIPPADIEATFFAGITSVSNSGNKLATLWSGKMLIALGVDYIDPATNERTYDLQKLEVAIWTRFVMTFLDRATCVDVPNSSSIDPYGDGAKREPAVAEDAAEVADAKAKNLEDAKPEERTETVKPIYRFYDHFSFFLASFRTFHQTNLNYVNPHSHLHQHSHHPCIPHHQ
ncbi:BT1 family-domain-containing protein [Cladochytrium replicatum]|nr:BT1 family-domain-containing protein [Cladochytrium replicatum]